MSEDKKAYEDICNLGYVLELSPFETGIAGLNVKGENHFHEFHFFPTQGHCFIDPLSDAEPFLTLDKKLKELYPNSDVDAQAVLECAVSYLENGE